MRSVFIRQALQRCDDGGARFGVRGKRSGNRRAGSVAIIDRDRPAAGAGVLDLRAVLAAVELGLSALKEPRRGGPFLLGRGPDTDNTGTHCFAVRLFYIPRKSCEDPPACGPSALAPATQG